MAVQKVYMTYDSLPNVQLNISGGISVEAEAKLGDVSRRSHFEQDFNFRIDQDSDELVIRIAKKPGPARLGFTNVVMRIEGGLSEQPDGRVVFDGGVESGHGNGVSTFGLSFKISHEQEVLEEEEPEEKEVAFFDHSEHKLVLAPENVYKNSPGAYCDACMENLQMAKWVYKCPNAGCNYCVHAACAQFPRTIRHPSHPQHTVKLLKLSPTSARQCDACYTSISHGLHYHCAKCDFDAHPMCPKRPKTPKSDMEWYRSTHQGMTPQEYLAHTNQLLNLQCQKLMSL
ncbi:hypothetical protein M758_3G190500 [Ceratodon purpureus]|nr:hypothetical protein M758_3G190500 [Ceratodon purpureus]